MGTFLRSLDRGIGFDLTQAFLGINLCCSAVPRVKRVKTQSSSTATCKPSASSTSYQLLNGAIWQHLSSVLFLLLSLGAGLGAATAQPQTSAYVTNTSGTVSVIDTATNTVVATIPVGIFPSGVAITPDGTRAYVANILNSISVIDTATNTVLVTIPSGQFPTGLAITPDGTRAYVVNQFVTNQGDNTVSVIDIMTNTIVATIPVGLGAFEVAITPDGTRTYVPHQQDSILSVIDTATNTVVETIPVGVRPVAVALIPAPQTPTSKQHCKHDGYLKFGPPAGPFKNQGQCVSYVEHRQHQ